MDENVFKIETRNKLNERMNEENEILNKKQRCIVAQIELNKHHHNRIPLN